MITPVYITMHTYVDDRLTQNMMKSDSDSTNESSFLVNLYKKFSTVSWLFWPKFCLLCLHPYCNDLY